VTRSSSIHLNHSPKDSRCGSSSILRRSNEASLRALSHEQQRQATAFAQESKPIVNNRCVGGVGYFEVITAPTFVLNNERNDIDIPRRSMDSSARLIKVLGGGSHRAQLPPQ
jgi:outer membrane protein TolC